MMDVETARTLHPETMIVDQDDGDVLQQSNHRVITVFDGSLVENGKKLDIIVRPGFVRIGCTLLSRQAIMVIAQHLKAFDTKQNKDSCDHC